MNVSGSGERINHLLHMEDLKLYSNTVQTVPVRVFCQDIGMEFGIDKCATIDSTEERKVGEVGWNKATRSRWERNEVIE